MTLPLSPLEKARAARPDASDAELVRSLAAGIIADLDIDEPPVDVEMVASWLGIESIVIDDDLPVSGMLRQDGNGRFEILRSAGPSGVPAAERGLATSASSPC